MKKIFEPLISMGAGDYNHAEKSFMCRITYMNGKMCYGRLIKNVCEAINLEDEYVSKIEMMIMSENCNAQPAWSQCAGEDGRSENCGPGTQSRTINGVLETQDCFGVCNEFCSMHLFPMSALSGKFIKVFRHNLCRINIWITGPQSTNLNYLNDTNNARY
jgi:hypothetical protein